MFLLYYKGFYTDFKDMKNPTHGFDENNSKGNIASLIGRQPYDPLLLEAAFNTGWLHSTTICSVFSVRIWLRLLTR